METEIEHIEDILRYWTWSLDYYLHKFFNLFRKKEPLGKVERIIIVDLKFIGDLIIDTPLIRALRKRFPKAEINILVYESMKDVLYKNPNLKRIYSYENDLEELKKEKFDLGVLLYPGSFGMSLFLKGIADYRIGIRRAGMTEPKGFFMNKKPKPVPYWKHKIEDNLDVARLIDADVEDKHLEVYTDKESDEAVRKKLMEKGINDEDYVVVIHPCANYKTHDWFEDRFANVANRLMKQGKKVVFTGVRNDRSMINNIAILMSNKPARMEGTTIKEFFSVIKRADLVISVDTAAMHVAAALNKKVIALFGAGNPNVWHPYTKEYKVIFKEDEAHTRCWKNYCRYFGERHMECMKAIHEQDVMNAIKELMK